MIEDFEPQIDNLTDRFTKAELAIAAILGSVAASSTPRDLTAAQRQIAAILTQLLAEVAEWITVNIPEIYADGAQEAARSMILRLPEGVLRERLRTGQHGEILQGMADDWLADISDGISVMTKDARKRLNEIRRIQRFKALANTNPLSRVGDFKAQMEEWNLAFVDRAGRRWKPSVYAKTVLLTQTGAVLNAGNLNTAAEFGSPGVRVSDGGPGDVDSPCITADRQNWSLGYAATHLLEHPRCRRSFAALPPSWTGDLDKEVA